MLSLSRTSHSSHWVELGLTNHLIHDHHSGQERSELDSSAQQSCPASQSSVSSLFTHPILTHIPIGLPHTPQEMEAERMADQVMSDFSHPTATPPDRSTSLQNNALKGNSVESVLQQAGHPLPPLTRFWMEQKFGGVDFGHVRIHDSPSDCATAASINARAFTFGHHIVGSVDDPRRLAHELAHVKQQQSQPGSSQIQRMILNERNEVMQWSDVRARLMPMGLGAQATHHVIALMQSPIPISIGTAIAQAQYIQSASGSPQEAEHGSVTLRSSAQILSHQLEQYDQAPTLTNLEGLKLRGEKILEYYHQGQLSLSAHSTVQNLFEQLHLATSLKDTAYRIHAGDLKRLSLEVAVEPPITKVAIDKQGKKYRQPLDHQYLHDYFVTQPGQIPTADMLEKLEILKANLQEWMSVANHADMIDEIEDGVADILKGDINDEVPEGIVTSRDQQGKLAAVLYYTYLQKPGIAQILYITASPESQRPLAQRPEGTMLRAGTATYIATMHHLVEQWPNLRFIKGEATHDRAAQSSSDLYFFSSQTHLPTQLFHQDPEHYLKAKKSLLGKKSHYLLEIILKLEHVSPLYKAKLPSDFLKRASSLKNQLATLNRQEQAGSIYSMLDHLKMELGQLLILFQKQTGLNLASVISYEADRLFRQTLS